MEADLRGPRLRPHQAALCLWGAVDLIMHVFTGVHVEAGVEEGAVPQTLICVLVDDAAE